MALHATRDTEDPAAFFANAPAGPLELTVLVDNKADGARLAAEHGFSLLLGLAGKQILFDTGQGPALRHNTSALEISFHALDALALSHGHYDHTGGTPEVLRQNPNVRIFAHPDLFTPRYSQRNAPPQPIGIPQAANEALGGQLSNITWTPAPTRITDGVWVTGAIPRINDFEDTGGPFFLDPECRRPDPIEGDQALWIHTPKGIVVILGCAHAGVVNTLDHIARLTGSNQFHAVIGGMHLVNADQNRLLRTLEALKRYRIKILAPCHCTGQQAQDFLKETFKDQYVDIQAGTRIAIC